MKIHYVYCHPFSASSRLNASFKAKFEANTEEIKKREDVDLHFHDLAVIYPDFNYDTKKERDLLLAADRIVLHFPFHNFSCPWTMKKWLDEVLTKKWLTVPRDSGLTPPLLGKEIVCVTTAGNPEYTYHAGGINRFTVDEFLRPVQQQVTAGRMHWLKCYVIYNGEVARNDEELDVEFEELVDHVVDKHLHSTKRLTAMARKEAISPKYKKK